MRLLSLLPLAAIPLAAMAGRPKERVQPLATLLPCVCDTPASTCPNVLLSPQHVCECTNSNALACWLKNGKNCAKPVPVDCSFLPDEAPDLPNVTGPIDVLAPGTGTGSDSGSGSSGSSNSDTDSDSDSDSSDSSHSKTRPRPLPQPVKAVFKTAKRPVGTVVKAGVKNGRFVVVDSIEDEPRPMSAETKTLVTRVAGPGL